MRRLLLELEPLLLTIVHVAPCPPLNSPPPSPQLAKQYHPDTSGDSSKATSEQFTKIQSAWETLGDDKARKEYDHKSVAWPGAGLARCRMRSPSCAAP